MYHYLEPCFVCSYWRYENSILKLLTLSINVRAHCCACNLVQLFAVCPLHDLVFRSMINSNQTTLQHGRNLLMMLKTKCYGRECTLFHLRPSKKIKDNGKVIIGSVLIGVVPHKERSGLICTLGK